jgi:hypothetical protein
MLMNRFDIVFLPDANRTPARGLTPATSAVPTSPAELITRRTTGGYSVRRLRRQRCSSPQRS